MVYDVKKNTVIICNSRDSDWWNCC